jgi:hypothetical protein
MTIRKEIRPLQALLLSAVAVALANCGGGTTVGSNTLPTSPSGNSGTPAPGTATTPAPGTSSTPAPGTSSGPAPGTSSAPGAGSTSTPSASGNAAVGIPFPAATDSDPFYAQPSPFPNLAHGTILSSRSITYEPDDVTMPNTAYQVKFVSQDIYGRKIAAVMTVVEPLTPAAAPEPLYVEAFPEDSLTAQCAPSHFATGGTADGDTQDSNEVAETPIATGALSAGYTLVMPDFEGPFSEYAVARQSGYITLDSMIAAENFAPLGLNAKTPIGENGYSGGAHAVSWAAAEQPTYAPELNLVGTSSGGTPADILGILENIDGTSSLSVVANEAFFDIIYMSAVGINRGYPNFLTPILNAKGVAAAVAMENGCVGKNSDGSSGPSGHFADYVAVSPFYTNPHVLTTTEAASEPQFGLVPTSNMFIYHSVTDELIPVAGVDNLVKTWCGDGTPIEYYRAANGGDHVTMDVQTQAIVLAYMADRFNGSALTLPPQTTDCN